MVVLLRLFVLSRIPARLLALLLRMPNVIETLVLAATLLPTFFRAAGYGGAALCKLRIADYAARDDRATVAAPPLS